MDNQISSSNPSLKNLSHFRLWLVVISIIVVVGTLAVLVIYRGTLNFGGNNNPQPTSSPDYGVFLDKGQLDYWELAYWHAKLGISDESGNEIKDYVISISDTTKIIRNISSTSERKSGNQKFVTAELKDIKKGNFVEIYLNNSYKNVEARVTTIIITD